MGILTNITYYVSSKLFRYANLVRLPTKDVQLVIMIPHCHMVLFVLLAFKDMVFNTKYLVAIPAPQVA